MNQKKEKNRSRPERHLNAKIDSRNIREGQKLPLLITTSDHSTPR